MLLIPANKLVTTLQAEQIDIFTTEHLQILNFIRDHLHSVSEKLDTFTFAVTLPNADWF